MFDVVFGGLKEEDLEEVPPEHEEVAEPWPKRRRHLPEDVEEVAEPPPKRRPRLPKVEEVAEPPPKRRPQPPKGPPPQNIVRRWSMEQMLEVKDQEWQRLVDRTLHWLVELPPVAIRWGDYFIGSILDISSMS